MLNKLKKAQQQWGGSSDAIDHWLDTRKNVIVEYCNLAKTGSSNQKMLGKLPNPEELQSFCQHLVDYISEGHFKVYDMVMDKWKSTGFSPTDEINQVYELIVLTTDPLLNFTDKYAKIAPEEALESFDDDLSLVGEIIETRFEQEDQLIQQIANSLAMPPGA